MSAPPSRALYLPSGGGTFAVLHPSGGQARTAVLLVPPFGWDDIASYRVRRTWADALADGGRPALRIDLPGTGDSAGGPDDPELVERWIGAVGDAAAWLRAETGAARVAVVGLGLGGLLALAAAGRGAEIDALVLWGAPARGRAAVRELRAFARLEAADTAPTPPELGLIANGHALRPATVDALSALDAADVAPRAGLRVLALGRDGMAPDAKLVAALEASAPATLDTGEGRGWGAMMERPQDAVAPRDVFAEVAAWLAAGEDAPAAAPTAAAPPAAPATDALDLGAAVERPLVLGDAFGILAEPAHRPVRATVLLLNAGAIRHVGPNRMYVEAARRWAPAGIATLRLDVAGIGDAGGGDTDWSDDATFHRPELVEQVRAAIAALAARGLPAPPLLAGLCSGAHWAFQVALADPGVRRVVLLNPRALFWEHDLSAARDLRHYLQRARSPQTWRRALRGELSLAYPMRRAPDMLRRLARAPLRALARLRHRGAGADPAAADPIGAALRRLAANPTEVQMLFVAQEPLHADLEREGHLRAVADLPGIEIRRIGGDVAAHTLQPVALQAEVHALLDAAVELEREP